MTLSIRHLRLPGIAAALSLVLGACQTGTPMQRTPFIAVPGHGATVEASDAAMQVDPSVRYRVVFPGTRAAEVPQQVVSALERAARFLNLLGASGHRVRPGDVVVVLSGPATPAVLSDPAWRSRHSGDEGNPNLPLIRALRDAGAVVSVCSQALHAQKIAEADVDPSVRRDLSAMTTLATLQAQGYALVPE